MPGLDEIDICLLETGFAAGFGKEGSMSMKLSKSLAWLCSLEASQEPRFGGEHMKRSLLALGKRASRCFAMALHLLPAGTSVNTQLY